MTDTELIGLVAGAIVHTDPNYTSCHMPGDNAWGGGHWWSPSDVPVADFPFEATIGPFHIYGQIWVPGTRWQSYLDNVSVATFPYS
jgi:hypothetical protein